MVINSESGSRALWMRYTIRSSQETGIQLSFFRETALGLRNYGSSTFKRFRRIALEMGRRLKEHKVMNERKTTIIEVIRMRNKQYKRRMRESFIKEDC